jgi:hypothetical protein
MSAPCKHLDHSSTYEQTCILHTIEDGRVKYWERKIVPYEGAPVNVQFCGLGRGRINSIFACYNPGEMSCYEPEATV